VEVIKMILELSQDEMVVFNSLVDSGLSDFAVLAQMFHIYGITTSMFKRSEFVEAIEGCEAS
jgi:hypothetical protein